MRGRVRRRVAAVKGCADVPKAVHEDEKCQRFAANLKVMREARGWTQSELARKCLAATSMVSNIETLQRAPTVLQGKSLDGAFGLDDMFAKAAREIRGEEFPEQFGKFSDYEATAISVFTYQHSLIPGLVQTEDYARAVLRTRPKKKPEEIERRVLARLARQEILGPDRERPTELHALIDEGALRRPTAPAPVMYRQLLHLAEISDWPHIHIAVVPYTAGGHSGLVGAFTMARQPDLSTIVWLEDAADGRTTDDPARVAQVMGTYDSLQMDALSRGQSRDVIAGFAEELWNRPASTGARALTAATTAPTA
jgi:transcriptional regulator with XRE-family HTH domain